MQSMAEECFELTFSSKVCEATNTISDEPTPKLDSAIETMCRKTGEVMRQLVKHEILQKWGVLWVPRWNISSCITNKITSPNQPNIWMPLCNNVFWHFFRGWGVIIGDSLAISRQSNCRQLSHFAICRQSKYRQSINRLSTFLPPRKHLMHLLNIQVNPNVSSSGILNIWSNSGWVAEKHNSSIVLCLFWSSDSCPNEI